MAGLRFQLKVDALCRVTKVFVLLLTSLLLTSCATHVPSNALVSPSQLPAEITLAPEASRGGHLMVTLRLESGEELPVILDTGAPATVLDKSLESKLGRRRGTMPVRLAGQPNQQCGIYDPPKLFLGSAPLVTGPIVAAFDFNRHPMGILGMDCLQHYCIQMDFQAGKLRFLKPDAIHTADLGQAFPLAFEGSCPCIRQSNLVGESPKPLLVDVGCNVDGLLDRGTNHLAGVYLPECDWAGYTYSNLTVAAVEHGNALGLRFLSRHLVTFDFPRRMLYLKPTSVGPMDQDDQQDSAASPRRSALKFLSLLKNSHQLPGWIKGEKEQICFDEQTGSAGNMVTFTFWVSGDSDRHHYQVGRLSQSDAWKLCRAWRANQSGQQLEEYPIP